MHEPTMSKRRLVLKMLGGAPMLPLGAVGAATLLAGCRAGADGARAAARGAGPRGDFAAAAFTSMAAPSLDAPEKWPSPPSSRPWRSASATAAGRRSS